MTWWRDRTPYLKGKSSNSMYLVCSMSFVPFFIHPVVINVLISSKLWIMVVRSSSWRWTILIYCWNLHVIRSILHFDGTIGKSLKSFSLKSTVLKWNKNFRHLLFFILFLMPMLNPCKFNSDKYVLKKIKYYSRSKLFPLKKNEI